MSRARSIGTVALVSLLIAGCVAAPTADDPLEDPDRERGVVDGIAHDDALQIDASDGLNGTERELVVARTMARVEHLRGLKFRERVPVEVISRDEYRERRAERTEPSEAYRAWLNAVWFALFHVDEETDAHEAFETLYGGAIQGYYSSSNERITLVADGIAIDRATLAHELVHALQDQHYGLERNTSTLDRSLAGQGIVEGDARYVEYRYEDRCESGEWECLDRPPLEPYDTEVDEGLLVTILHPYSDGPAFVHHVYEREGWGGVADVYDRHPTSTSQVIHPETYPDRDPVSVDVPDRSNGEWSRFAPPERDRPAQTVGEAALYATLWANGVIDRSHLRGEDHPYSRYDYAHPITTGWIGDALVVYRDGDDAHAYVFATEWESEADARAFREAYVELLEGHDAEPHGDAYRIPDDASFSGAYRVERSGTTVTVVYAPSAAELNAVHAPDATVAAMNGPGSARAPVVNPVAGAVKA